jgi:RpiB/LacA/LacB family sugar-phosphate isomerase
MRIAVASDMDTSIARKVVEELRARGYEPIPHGALAEGERTDWAWSCERAARDVAGGAAEQGIVCCWTGTGASIAANKVPGVRAAVAWNEDIARLAREHNDANVLTLAARVTPFPELAKIVRAWFAAKFDGGRHARRVEKISEIEQDELAHHAMNQ